MAVALGSIIWTAIRAILKFVLTAACGTLLAKAKILDSNGTRTISQCVLNVFLPCLLFAKIVQGIDQSNLPQVGVLVLTAVLYTALGLVFGFIVRFLTRVPRGWESGVLAAGAFSNWGDLPIVLITTVVAAPPFGGANDEAKGLAYVAVYMFVQSTIMFVCNGVWLVARDYDHPVSDTESIGVVGKVKNINAKVHSLKRRAVQRYSQGQVQELQDVEAASMEAAKAEMQPISSTLTNASNNQLGKIQSLRPSESLGMAARRTSAETLYLRPVTSGVLNHGDIHSTIDVEDIERRPSNLPNLSSETVGTTETARSLTITTQDAAAQLSLRAKWSAFSSSIKAPLLRLLSPPSAATISAFIIAIVPVLKALFVVVQGVNMPSAPDGNPPLSFLLDITNFIGAASVPSSLLILGYSLSRLKFSNLPGLKSAILMAILKMIVLPIIAIAWMQFLARPGGLIDATDLVLRLTLVLPAAVPTATALLYITQIFAPEGRDEGIQTLSVFLIVQYLLVGFTLTVTLVYTLNIIT